MNRRMVLLPDGALLDEAYPPLFPTNEPPAALAFLTDALKPLGSQDCEIGCKYVLGGRSNNVTGADMLRNEANARVEYLTRRMGDLPALGDVFTTHLHEEVREWLVWLAGFGVAQEEIAVCYLELRTRTRWKQYFIRPTELHDDRLVLGRMCDAITRGLEVCKEVPLPRKSTSRLFHKLSSLCLTLGHSFLLFTYIAHSWALSYWAITFRRGLTDYCGQIARFPYHALAFSLGIVILCLCFTYTTRVANPSITRAEYQLEQTREETHKWLLAWNTLLCLARKMLDDEKAHENRGQYIIHILAQLDHIIECPREIRYLRNAPTVLETLNAHTIHIPDREALARDMVTRIRPLIDGLTSTDHASSDGTQFSDVSQSPDDAESSSKARLDVMISTACEEPSARDALFGLFIRSGYGLLPTRLRLSNSNLPHPLLDAVDDLIRALKTFQHPEFIQETLQLFFDNMHARLAWIGGLGRAQREIRENLAKLDDVPSRAQLCRVSNCIEHYFHALESAPLAPLHDLSAAPWKRQAKLVLIEVFKCFIHDLAILPLFFTPTFEGGDGLIDSLFAIAYAFFARNNLEPISYCALAGLRHFACSYRDHMEVQTVCEAAARVEFHARSQLVHWRLLHMLMDALIHASDSENAANAADMNRLLAIVQNSSVSPTTDIDSTLESAMGKRTDWPLAAEPYAHANAVRSIIDKHYPSFQREPSHLRNKRGRLGLADDGDLVLLLDEYTSAEGPLRQRYRTQDNLPDESAV
ncbi:hypothetical protein EV715DRAFT_259617 [Schizophyllum commune]